MHKIISILIVIIAVMFPSNSFAHEYKDYVLNCIEIVNQKRESRPFLKPFKTDKELQEKAELVVLEMATLNHKEHLNKRQRGSQYNFYPIGSAEGIGYSGNSDFTGKGFVACYVYSREFTHAGAACAINRNGNTFYCIILK